MKADEIRFDTLPEDIDLTAYVGRWVAIAGGQVAGVGETAPAAAHMGRQNRLREQLVLYFVNPPGGEELTLPPLLERLRPILAWQSQPVYLVGGAVRDLLLGRETNDLDFVVPDQAVQLAFRIADQLGVPAYVLDRERDAGRVVVSEAQTTLDFVRLRGPNLEADLRARDFTVNAMALPAMVRSQASIIDPCNGRRDLTAGRLQLTHSMALWDDPVRTLRAVRLASELDFTLSAETEAALPEAASSLKQVSIERVRDELTKLIRLPDPADAISNMSEWELLPQILPELDALKDVDQSPPHRYPALVHTIQAVHWVTVLETFLDTDGATAEERLEPCWVMLKGYRQELVDHLNRYVDGGLDGRVLLRLGTAFHDVGKAHTQTVEPDGRLRFFGHDKVGARLTARRLDHLRFSKQAVRHVRAVVDGHLRPLLLSQSGPVSRRAIYRFFRDYEAAGVDIGLLALADHLATYDGVGDLNQWERLIAVVDRLLEHYFEKYEETVKPPPLVNGKELMQALDLEPGPLIGRLLDIIEEAQAAGEIRSQDEAIQLARRLVDEGPSPNRSD